ncbi:Mur ligase domain-containing protein, partial [Octadecabacter sp.]|nr:Mur ligase domain-containing protein [Octadecabacter sp.]
MSSQAEQKTSTLAALGLRAQGGRCAMITGLTVDSRDVKDGTLFFALPGSKVHGAAFIQYALRIGAAAILTDAQGAEIAKKELADSDAALIIAEDPRGALAQTASLWFGAHPSTVIAVTGTNGKTS